MPRKSEIDPAIKQGVLERLAQGVKGKDVAREFNIKDYTVSYIKKRAALNGGRGIIEQEGDSEDEPSMANIGHRGFIAKAWQAREDALWSWKALTTTTISNDVLDLAIEAAEGASRAWRKAAMELERKRK